MTESCSKERPDPFTPAWTTPFNFLESVRILSLFFGLVKSFLPDTTISKEQHFRLWVRSDWNQKVTLWTPCGNSSPFVWLLCGLTPQSGFSQLTVTVPSEDETCRNIVLGHLEMAAKWDENCSSAISQPSEDRPQWSWLLVNTGLCMLRDVSCKDHRSIKEIVCKKDVTSCVVKFKSAA